MAPGSKTPDNALPDVGLSEEDAADAPKLKPQPGAKGQGDGHGDKTDAAETAGTKRRDGGDSEHKSAPGAIAPDQLSGENDDGAG